MAASADYQGLFLVYSFLIGKVNSEATRLAVRRNRSLYSMTLVITFLLFESPVKCLQNFEAIP